MLNDIFDFGFSSAGWEIASERLVGSATACQFTTHNSNMGKSTEAEMANPMVNRSEGFHALTRAEEENCFKELKKNALHKCEVPIKGLLIRLISIRYG